MYLDLLLFHSEHDGGFRIIRHALISGCSHNLAGGWLPDCLTL